MAPSIAQLPDDIVILIAQYLTISDVYALRRTSQYLNTSLQLHVKSVSRSVAHNTFPTSVRLFHDAEAPTAHDFNWLQDLYPKYLAALVLDRRHWGDLVPFGRSVSCIPTEDLRGDDLRSKVAVGWRVLHRSLRWPMTLASTKLLLKQGVDLMES